MVDAHSHLNFHAFKKDVEEVIKNAHEKGIKAIITVGTKADSNKSAVTIAQKNKNVYASVGFHPHHSDKLEKDWVKDLEKIAKEEKVISIGECGMDFYSYESNGIVNPEIQKDVFEQQILLSSKLKLPLQIHNRHAEKEVTKILENNKENLNNPPGLMHCFSGSKEFLFRMLDLGFYIGFDGNITYKGFAPGENVSLTDILKITPLNRIITETDSPFLSPIPYRGLRNEPKNVIIISEFISKEKKVGLSDLKAKIDDNFSDLFKIKI